MSASTASHNAKRSVVPVPGSRDPHIAELQRAEVAGWVANQNVSIGKDWTRTFTVRSHQTLAQVICRGAEIYERIIDNPLVSRELLGIVMNDYRFSKLTLADTVISLHARPRGGADESLPNIRRAFHLAGRELATTPEVVAGFVVNALATSLPGLEKRVQRLTAEQAGGARAFFNRALEYLTAGFCPGPTFRILRCRVSLQFIRGAHPFRLSWEQSSSRCVCR